jgi:phosphoesterase RecJ-like protein
MATCILTGLATDTGSFIYPSTNRKAIAIAAEMLWRGARLPVIIKETFYRQNLSALKIWGLAMSRLTINPKYQIAYTILTYQDYLDLNADEAMTDELAGWLACLEGVKAVLFLKETKPGLIKGSWRAVDPDYDVARLARAMGGGGHVKAAGFAVRGSIKNLDGVWSIE